MPVQLEQLLAINTPPEDLLTTIRRSPAAPALLSVLRRAAPDLTAIPQTTYTLYREFEHTGRGGVPGAAPGRRMPRQPARRHAHPPDRDPARGRNAVPDAHQARGQAVIARPMVRKRRRVLLRHHLLMTSFYP